MAVPIPYIHRDEYIDILARNCKAAGFTEIVFAATEALPEFLLMTGAGGGLFAARDETL